MRRSIVGISLALVLGCLVASHAAEAQQRGKVYRIGVLGLGYAPINESLKAFLLVCTTLAKILVIAAIFMHLRYERLNLILLTFAPLILAIIMFAFTFPETLGTSTHIIAVR